MVSSSGRYFRFSNLEEQQLDYQARQSRAQPASLLTDTFNSQGTFGGIDMFHSLHCLNSLRKAVAGSMGHGIQGLQANYTQLHINHCIEHLRQAILCHGDLTPVTLKPVVHTDGNILDLVGQTEYPDTCRDWTSLRQEMDKRETLNFGGLV